MEGPLWEREEECSAIAAALEGAAGGRGTALFFRGEPGLGKTRLLALAATRAQERFAVIWVGAHELEQSYPFAVAQQVAEALPRVYGAASEELAGGLKPLRALLRRSLQGGGVGDAPARFEVVYALYWLLASLAERQPLLLCLDDLHWSDPDSLEAVRFLTARTEALPMAVVGGLRPWPPLAGQVAERLRREDRAELWDLKPLGREAAAGLLGQCLEGKPTSARVDEAHRLTGGNPFLLEEMARIWQTEDLPRAAEGSALVLTRLAGLPASSLALLEAASVFGSEFPLAAAWKLSGVAEPEDALSPLLGLGLLREREEGRAAFVHPLLRQAVYEGLSLRARRELHRRAAELLRAGGARPAELAPHLVQAASPGDLAAVRELRAAATEAAALGAYEAAAAHLRSAADLTPPGPERVLTLYELGRACQRAGEHGEACAAFAAAEGGEGWGGAPACRVHCCWGFSLTLAGDTAGAREHLDRAVAAAGEERSLAVEAAVARVVLEMTTGGMLRAREAAQEAMRLAESGSAADHAKASAVWANVAFQLGDRQAHAVAQKALRDLPEVPPDDVELLWGWSPRVALGMIAMRSERYGEAEELLRAAQEAARSRRARYAFAWASTFLAELEWRRGRLRDAFRYSGDAALYPLGVPWVTALAYSVRGRILLEMGDLEGAEASFVRSEAECRQAALGLALLWCGWGRAALAARRGDAARAAELFRREGAAAGVMGIADPNSFRWQQEAAEAWIRAGELAQAQRMITGLHEAAVSFGRGGMEAAALRGQGMLEAVRGRREGAEERFRTALALHRTVDESLERARTLLAYGTFLRQEGDLRRARGVLDEAVVVCEACGAAYWQRLAEGERRAAGGRRRARPREGVLLGRLTPQEYRIAELVSQGSSNRQIACLLLISPKTLETHLHHLYEKLEVTSREALRDYFAAHAPQPAATPAQNAPLI
jgi:DNA-binding CsgD family transcriptional regulator/tetratricopeptide (TPR) repeat protein